MFKRIESLLKSIDISRSTNFCTAITMEIAKLASFAFTKKVSPFAIIARTAPTPSTGKVEDLALKMDLNVDLACQDIQNCANLKMNFHSAVSETGTFSLQVVQLWKYDMSI